MGVFAPHASAPTHVATMLTCLQQPERHQVSVRGQDGKEDKGASHKHAEGGEHTVD